MSYPRNAASPERIAVGAVVQISDGAVQSSGVSISVRGQGGASGAGGGTTAYDNGIVEYTPIQAETDFTSFIVVAYKTGCIPVSITIVTSASATPGHAGVDWGQVANKTTTNALTNTTIATTQKVDVETIKTNPVVNAGTITFPTTATLASTTNITAGTITTATNVTTVNGLAANVITAASIPDSTWQELIELMFTYNATADYAGADAGSLVKQIADNAGGTSLTEAGIAAEVWGTAVPGAFGAGTAGSRLGRVPDVASGASGGLLIAGSNAATTFATLTVTGLVAFSDGMTITAATTDRSALVLTGTGAGHGMNLVPGATGSGFRSIGGATSGDAVTFTGIAGNSRGIMIQGQGSGAGFRAVGGSSGVGGTFVGGSGSGAGLVAQSQGGNSAGFSCAGSGAGGGINATAGPTGSGIDANGGATSGAGMSIDSTSGDALTITAGGGNGDGIQITGQGSGDGLNVIAGATGDALVLSNTSSGVPFTADGQDVLALWLAAGSAGDPWSTALPGAYSAGTAGFIIGNNVNATISSRSSHSAADVWSVGTRSLTVLDEDSTTIDLDATIRAAVGLATANLDTQLGDLPTNAELAAGFGTADDAVLAAIAALPSFDPTTEEVETGFTWTESARLWNAAMGGKASGLETTNALYRDLADSKNRINATVDVDGNRTAVTLDLT